MNSNESPQSEKKKAMQQLRDNEELNEIQEYDDEFQRTSTPNNYNPHISDEFDKEDLQRAIGKANSPHVNSNSNDNNSKFSEDKFKKRESNLNGFEDSDNTPNGMSRAKCSKFKENIVSEEENDYDKKLDMHKEYNSQSHESNGNNRVDDDNIDLGKKRGSNPVVRIGNLIKKKFSSFKDKITGGKKK